ncbi:hypothetical protein [Planotetraspora kaengkrachanensis]|nr:hypothetical protein [Planotetraspora kaengkrachanensis]
MNPMHEEQVHASDRWVFGLEEIPASDKGEDGEIYRVASSFGQTVIRAPVGTPQTMQWAAEEIVAQCGPEWSAAAILLQWLRIEAGDERRLGVESCVLERISDDEILFHAHYNQWEDITVLISDVRRMLIDMMHFITNEARHPLPRWRIKYLSERDWTQKRVEG